MATPTIIIVINNGLLSYIKSERPVNVEILVEQHNSDDYCPYCQASRPIVSRATPGRQPYRGWDSEFVSHKCPNCEED